MTRESHLGGGAPQAVEFPRFVSLRARLARSIMDALGWTFSTTHSVDLTRDDLREFPPKWIVFGEPHTHYADFFVMLLFFRICRLPRVSFPVNAKYFVPIVGAVLRRLGAIPVDTSRRNDLVASMVERFEQSESMILHIAPSGTRARTDRWRSGFYHIALQAEVPVFLAYLDASTRSYGYSPPLWLTGDVGRDMDEIRAFYADKRGFVPENESAIRLKEELELPQIAPAEGPKELRA